MLISMIGLSLISFLAVIFGTLGGLDRDDYQGGIWPTVLVLPYIALPLSIVLIIVLVILSARRRARSADTPDRRNR